jgi:hypothetical protein
MPATAKKALEGMLAEGVTADEILSALSSSGYDIEPPKDDDSYDEAPEGGSALIIGVSAEPEEMENSEEDDKDKNGKRMAAAEKAMKKHGY